MSYFVFKKGHDKFDSNGIAVDLWSIPLLDMEGKSRTLSEFKNGKTAFIFVNVACKCGLTSDNYTQLVDMYKKYKSNGLEILGFPCGQFFSQELETDKEIKEFVEKKFEVDFPMFGKIEVNGENTHMIFKYLKFHSSQMNDDKGLKNIPWNFSKFLVDSNGKVIKYYEPKIKPNELLAEITPMLIRKEAN